MNELTCLIFRLISVFLFVIIIFLRKEKREAELLSVTDEMTGLDNRRGLILKSETLTFPVNGGGERRNGGEVADVVVLYLDINELKTINDTHGHSFGDRIICHVATSIKGSVRACDIVCRIGGDEFLVILQGIKLSRGEEIARTIYFNVKSISLRVNSSAVKTSVSIGATTCDSRSCLEQSIARADKAMYIAKRMTGVTVYVHKDR